jgi:single-stranded DNA-binding protein
VSADRWKGEYYDNPALTGNPVMTRDDGAGSLNFNFATGSPHPLCAPAIDNFSARWMRTVNFPRGVYRFTITVDDGVRLYVDGQLKIDKWLIQGATTYTTDVFLAAGAHEIKLEYFESTGSALISLDWTTVVNCIANAPTDRWRGEYFNSATLTGEPAMARDDGDGFLNFNWGDGSPGSVCGQVVDNFSARWTRMVNFAAGAYRFIVTADNGVRLYVDGQLKIDQWANLPPNTYTADVSLSSGAHEIKLEFVEYGGAASVSLFWGAPNCLSNVPANRWKGEYFNNITLTGFPAMARDDGIGSLNFNFGDGGPGASCGLGVDNFSARWTRTVNFAASSYRFSVTGDDGVRLYVDGQLKIDQWISQGATTHTADVALTEGAHEVKLEYFESGGPGMVVLSWVDVTGVNCLPNTPLPLISGAPQTGGKENIASTAPSQEPRRCGQKIVAAPRAPGSD